MIFVAGSLQGPRPAGFTARTRAHTRCPLVNPSLSVRDFVTRWAGSSSSWASSAQDSSAPRRIGGVHRIPLQFTSPALSPAVMNRFMTVEGGGGRRGRGAHLHPRAQDLGFIAVRRQFHIRGQLRRRGEQGGDG